MMAGGRGTGMKNGIVIDEPYDSLSFVPTILSLMGRCEQHLPGPLIHGAGEMPCAAVVAGDDHLVQDDMRLRQ
jgi:hypothetical protein